MTAPDTSKKPGKIKWFSKERFYGFIIPDDGSDDVFMHGSDLPEGIDYIAPDTKVYYRTAPGKHLGVKAVGVELA